MKKIIVILLTVAMSLSLMGSVFAETDPCASFTDVNRSSWYHTALDFVVKNQLMSGTSKTTFAPGSTVSRAMTVQTFYAIAGKPTYSGMSAFHDVARGSWYFESVNWASANHLAAGTGGGAFRPNDNVTREQLAVFFKAFAGYRGKNATSRKALSGYVDQSSVSGYAKDAMSWAVAVGLISGKGSGRLAPKDTATRAELAQMLYRFMSISGSPASSETAKPSESPKPSETVNPTPAPSQTVKPSDEPKPTESLKPSETSAPTESPKPTAPTTPVVSPQPTTTPKPTETPQPSPTVTPKVPFQIVSISPSDPWLYVGETKQLKAVPNPKNTDETIQLEWETVDPSIVTVDQNGNVTALKAGKGKIRVTANQRYMATCIVTVTEKTENPITGVKINDSDVAVAIGERHQFSATVLPKNTEEDYRLSWKSDNPSAASINGQEGVLVGRAETTATITVSCNGKFTDTCKVTVFERTVELSAGQVSMEKGQTYKITCKKNPLDKENIQWFSDNPKVAAVKDGVITAYQPGGANITATVGDATATCSVSVNGFIDVTSIYDEVDAFRAEKGVWYWNSDNSTKTVFNTGSGNKLGALSRSPELEATAKLRAKELPVKYSHSRPDGTSCFTAYPNWSYLGENIAMGSDNLIQAVFTLWREETKDYSGQGHRRNMLDPNFNAIGIAGYYYNGRSYWVQAFGRR